MKSDLSKCKVGDVIGTFFGWMEIRYIDDSNYLVETNEESYTFDGLTDTKHKVPSAFTEEDCPEWLLKIIGPPPFKFKKGDKVLCDGDRAYFSHEANGVYLCFVEGRDEWSSTGRITLWPKDCVKPWEDEK